MGEMRRNMSTPPPETYADVREPLSPSLSPLCMPHTTRIVHGDEGDRLGPVGWELSDWTRPEARRSAAVLGKRSQRRCMLKPASGERLGVDDLSALC